jgi:hypothetical protein
MSPTCTHTDSITITELPPTIAGCEDCLAIGGTWVHLRMCQTCGHMGSCDSSPNRHASAHAGSSRSRRSVARALEAVVSDQLLERAPSNSSRLRLSIPMAVP